jgi:hypothetical protein
VTWREGANDAATGCSYFGCMFLLIPLGVIGVVAFFLGIDLLSGWLSPQIMSALDQPLGLAVLGVALILLSAWGMYRVVSRRPTSGVTPVGIFGCGLVALVIAAVGVWVLLGALTHQPGTPGF